MLLSRVLQMLQGQRGPQGQIRFKVNLRARKSPVGIRDDPSGSEDFDLDLYRRENVALHLLIQEISSYSEQFLLEGVVNYAFKT